MVFRWSLSGLLSYTEQIESIDEDDESDAVYDVFCDKIAELEKGLYLNTNYDMWVLLYEYVESHIKQQQ